MRRKLENNYSMSHEARILVCKLIVADPEKRLSAKQALQEAWFHKLITRESVTQLNNARDSFKERRIRKSLGLQEQFERMPIAAIRQAELLKSGLDLSTMFQVKRSISVSEPNSNFFAFSQGGRIRIHNSYVKSNKGELHSESNEQGRDSGSNSLPFDPLSPAKFDN